MNRELLYHLNKLNDLMTEKRESIIGSDVRDVYTRIGIIEAQQVLMGYIGKAIWNEEENKDFERWLENERNKN